MTNDLTINTPNPDNPAEIGYPPTLPIEVALNEIPIEDIQKAYNLSDHDWEILKTTPRFIADVAAAKDVLKKEGMSFRVKARLQSEELLKTSWKMIHAPSDEVPPNVKADLLKFTVRCAGLEGDPKAGASAAANFQININLG